MSQPEKKGILNYDVKFVSFDLEDGRLFFTLDTNVYMYESELKMRIKACFFPLANIFR